MIAPRRYTSGRIAVANLSASIAALQAQCHASATFERLTELSTLLFLRGDLLGRLADHDRAESIDLHAVSLEPHTARAINVRANLALRFHQFGKAASLLEAASAAGMPQRAIDSSRASVLQALGRYDEAYALRHRLAHADEDIATGGALASLLGEMGRWSEAELWYAAALEKDAGLSPIPAAQLLFEWGLSAMRRRELDRAEEIFATLDALLPAHVPGRGHRAEVALARGHFDKAMRLIAPLVDTSDDPEYRVVYAEALHARGELESARQQAEQAASGYRTLLLRRPEAYADHAAAFFIGLGREPQLAVDLARANWKLRDTARSRRLLADALRAVAALGTQAHEPALH